VAANVTVNDVRMSIVGADVDESRGEALARLMFDRTRDLLERELQHLDADVVIDHLDVPPVTVSSDTMDDEDIARAGAAGIHRALTAAL
jgi:hypothetical protein